MPPPVARGKIKTWATGSPPRAASESRGHREIVGVRSRAAGFTLLELMVALAVAALLLGVSAPATMRLYDSMQFRGAVRDVMGALNATRQQAIAAGNSADLEIEPALREMRYADTVRRLPDSIELEVTTARELNRPGVAVIRFYADGSASGGVVVLISEGGKRSAVEVDWLLGRVALCEGENCDAAV